jgi:hypothetical protein
MDRFYTQLSIGEQGKGEGPRLTYRRSTRSASGPLRWH